MWHKIFKLHRPTWFPETGSFWVLEFLKRHTWHSFKLLFIHITPRYFIPRLDFAQIHQI